MLVVYCILSTLMSYKLNYKVHVCKCYLFITLTPHNNNNNNNNTFSIIIITIIYIYINIYIYNIYIYIHRIIRLATNLFITILGSLTSSGTRSRVRTRLKVWSKISCNASWCDGDMTLDVANLGWLEKACTQINGQEHSIFWKSKLMTCMRMYVYTWICWNEHLCLDVESLDHSFFLSATQRCANCVLHITRAMMIKEVLWYVSWCSASQGCPKKTIFLVQSQWSTNLVPSSTLVTAMPQPSIFLVVRLVNIRFTGGLPLFKVTMFSPRHLLHVLAGLDSLYFSLF